VAAACVVPQQGEATGAPAAAVAVEPAGAGVWQPHFDAGAGSAAVGV
jgi:hypothetical protein